METCCMPGGYAYASGNRIIYGTRA
jgi:hypothetical protein